GRARARRSRSRARPRRRSRGGWRGERPCAIFSRRAPRVGGVERLFEAWMGSAHAVDHAPRPVEVLAAPLLVPVRRGMSGDVAQVADLVGELQDRKSTRL